MTLRSVPEPIDIEVPFFSYRRAWTLEGQDLRSRTEIVSTFDTRVCPPEIVNRISEALEREKEKPNPLVHLIALDAKTEP
jgi:hypothetical protein